MLLAALFISGHSLAETPNETSQCLQKLKKDARFASIADHVVLDGQDATAPMALADKTTPDGRQKAAIADWIDARSLCVNLSPTKIQVDLHLLFLSIVPDLYNDQTTFGEFNRKWHALFKEATEAPVKSHDNTVHRH